MAKNETPEQAEARKKRAREMKAKSRARQSKEQREEERAKARAAMARKRRQATPEEKAVMRAKAAARIKKMRENLSVEEREEVRARDRARKAKKRMEKLAMKNGNGTVLPASAASAKMTPEVNEGPMQVAEAEAYYASEPTMPVDTKVPEVEPMQVQSSPDEHDEVDALIGTTFGLSKLHQEEEPIMPADDEDIEPMPDLPMPVTPRASEDIEPMTEASKSDEDHEVDAMIGTAFGAPSLPKEVTEKREAEEKELGAMVSAAFGVSSGDNPWWQWL